MYIYIPLPFDTLNFLGSEDEGGVLPNVDAQTWFSPTTLIFVDSVVPSSLSSAAERFGSKMCHNRHPKTWKDIKWYPSTGITVGCATWSWTDARISLIYSVFMSVWSFQCTQPWIHWIACLRPFHQPGSSVFQRRARLVNACQCKMSCPVVDCPVIWIAGSSVQGGPLGSCPGF